MTREIVVSCDGSDGAQAALGVAIETAQGLGDRLVLVFGVEPPGREGEEVGEHRRALEEYGGKFVREAAERFRGAGLEVETELVPQSPVVALDGVARERA